MRREQKTRYYLCHISWKNEYRPPVPARRFLTLAEADAAYLMRADPDAFVAARKGGLVAVLRDVDHLANKKDTWDLIEPDFQSYLDKSIRKTED